MSYAVVHGCVEWRGVEDHWGTIERAHHIRVVGPFRTREIARQVDISNYHRYWMPRP